MKKGKNTGAPPRWERYVIKSSVQQICRTLRDKVEKEWRGVGARASNNTYHKCTKPNNTSAQNKHKTCLELLKNNSCNFIQETEE